MNSRSLETDDGAIAKDLLDLDVESIVEQVWNDLQGVVDRPAIRYEIGEVIPAFAGARIRTYVPIFVRRNTVRRLRARIARVTLEPKHGASRALQA